MGFTHAHRARMAPALVVVAVLLALAVILALGAFAGPAAAQGTFTTCSACHTLSLTHASGNANHTGIGCNTCHNDGGTAKPPLPSACASCHGATAMLTANPTHTSPPQSCATTPDCHGYVAPPTPATTTLTAKVAPATVTVGKKVKVSGLAGPVPALVGAKIALKVERKVGTKWVKMKTATATAGATGAYSWSYKATKKGAHHVIVSITQTATFTAKKLTKNFKVK